jgi:hypothetical protein
MSLIYMDLLLVDLWMPQTIDAINGMHKKEEDEGLN